MVAAATVGGIEANRTRSADFLYDNLAIATNVIDGAFKHGVPKLLYLSSSCIYPRETAMPMTEASLLTGGLEPTNQWYAMAKIVGIKLCDAYRHQHGADFISVVPASLYGPGDNSSLENGHVLPALMRRLHEAKLNDTPSVTIWGTGSPLREFLYIDDLADAVCFVARHYSGEGHLNIATGEEISIKDAAHIIRDIVGYRGELAFDTSRPDGMPRKVVDTHRLSEMGWRPITSLRQGLDSMYRWFIDRQESGTPIRGVS